MTDVLEELRRYQGQIKNGSLLSQALAVPLYYALLENLLMGKPPVDSLVSFAADYIVKTTDTVVLIDATVADRTVTLPPAVNVISTEAGTTRLLYIKKSDAGVNLVTIVPNAADTIEGASSYELSEAFQGVILVPDGNDWYILSTGGGGADPTARYYAAYGWTNANHYKTANGECQGTNAGFAVSVTLRAKHLSGTGTAFEVFSCRRQFAGGGWGLGIDGSRARMYVTLGDGTKLSNFVNANWNPSDNGNDMSSGSLLHLGLNYTGTTAELYVNGRLMTTIALANFLAEPTVGATFGIIPVDLADPFDGAIVGGSFNNAAVTADQMFAHYLACVDANDHVDGGIAWTNRWSFIGQATAPATLEDQNGNADMTRVGTLSIENLRGAWYRR
jgi:hypothetical protein